MTYVVLPVRESNSDKAPVQTLLAVTSQCFEFHSLVRLSFLSSTTFHLFLEEPIGALIAAGCLHYWPARQGAGSAEKGQEVNLWHINPTVFSTSCLLPKCNFVAFARCGVGNDCLNSNETGCLACTLSYSNQIDQIDALQSSVSILIWRTPFPGTEGQCWLGLSEVRGLRWLVGNYLPR